MALILTLILLAGALVIGAQQMATHTRGDHGFWVGVALALLATAALIAHIPST